MDAVDVCLIYDLDVLGGNAPVDVVDVLTGALFGVLE